MENNIKYKKGYPYPLGVYKIDGGIQFCTVVQKGKKVNLCLFKKNHKKASYTIQITEDFFYGNITSIIIENLLLDDYEYCYNIDGKSVVDNYAVSLKGLGPFGTNIDFDGVKCGFLNDFDWEETKNPMLPIGEIILYRMNVRGFTKHNSSSVEHRGTFKGIKEKIPYLIDLGINQIELMPVYEFIDTVLAKEKYFSVDNLFNYKCNYWGYSESNCYFSVKSSYASSSDASTELKELIRELHRNKIEIILEFYFPENTSVQLILDCLRFWLYEYHVDGFHISGNVPDMTIIAKEPFFTDIKLYSDYFDAYKIYGKTKNIYKNRHLIASTEQYKHTVRSFLKSDIGKSEETAYLMRRDDEAVASVNYICSHDGFTLSDMVSYEQKHNEANEEDNLDGTDYNFTWNCGIEGNTKKKKILKLRKRQMKNAWVMLLFSKGIPAILAGDEMCNSQNGNNNAYCQDNAVGWVNWKIPKVYSDLSDFVKMLIQLRKDYHCIWSTSENDPQCEFNKKFPLISYHGEKAWNVEFRSTDRHFAIMYYKEEEDSEKILYIAYNMNWNPQKFALPKLKGNKVWHSVVDTAFEEIQGDYKKIDKQYIFVKERACVILVAL